MTSLGIEVLGTAFTLSWGDAVTEAQRDSTRQAWSRCAAEATTPSALAKPPTPALPTEALPYTAVINFHTKLPGGGTRQLVASSFERLAESITSELTLAAILEQAGHLTMLHACGIADPDTGAVIALVAKSGTGKTTAVSVLARARGYVTDETVAIRPDGEVIPYPKPLSVKQHTAGTAKTQVGPDELGLKECSKELRISAIVLLDRSSDYAGKRPALRPVPLADAVLALIPDSSSQAKIPQPLQSLCGLIGSVGGVWRVEYAEAEDLVAALDSLFTPAGTTAATWSAPAGGEATGAALPPGCYLRITPEDAVEIDGELIVMLDTEVVRLSGIAPAIWKLAARPVTMQEVVRELEIRHGLPGGYQAQIDNALEEMIARGLLTAGRAPH